MSHGQERCYGGKNVCIRETPPEAPRVEVGPPPMNPIRETGGFMTETRQPSRQGGNVNTRACLPAQASHRPASRGHDSLARNRGASSQRGSSRVRTADLLRHGRRDDDDDHATLWGRRGSRCFSQPHRARCSLWSISPAFAYRRPMCFAHSQQTRPKRQGRPRDNVAICRLQPPADAVPFLFCSPGPHHGAEGAGQKQGAPNGATRKAEVSVLVAARRARQIREAVAPPIGRERQCGADSEHGRQDAVCTQSPSS